MLKMEYDSIYEQITKGAIIRSKATWYEKGEKSNKYFLKLETHKKAESSVRKVFNDEGVLITDPKKFCRRFKIIIPIFVNVTLSDHQKIC